MDGEKTRGAGCSKGQATSKTCSVGPSSLIDASDLDVNSLSSVDTHKAIGLNAHCPSRRTIRCWIRLV